MKGKMMSKEQPEALRLADALEQMPGYDFNKNYCEAAAELRRLHAENEVLLEQIWQGEPSQAVSDAYDRIDHFLRQKLDDHDYAHYSFDLDLVWGASTAPQQPLTDEQRRDLQKVRDSLDPEDWCGDERMVDVLDRVLVASCCVNFAAGTSCFADPKSNCPRLAVAHNIGEKK